MTFIVHIVCSSSKCHDELHTIKLDEIAHLSDINVFEMVKDYFKLVL